MLLGSKYYAHSRVTRWRGVSNLFSLFKSMRINDSYYRQICQRADFAGISILTSYVVQFP